MSASRYQNLPRIELTTLDGNLIAVRDRPLTESVLIIGPAIDGPTDRVISVNNVADIQLVYGNVVFDPNYTGPAGEQKGFSGNHLIKSLREVQRGGCADIRMLRICGNKSQGTFTMPAQVNAGATGTITFIARSNGRLYNQVAVSFTSGAVSGSVTVAQPTVKGGAFTVSYNTTISGQTIGEVIDRINSDTRNRSLIARAGTVSTTAPARVLHGGASLTGGTDGTQKDDMASSKLTYWKALTDATSGLFNDFLADYEADIILLAGVYVDDMVDTNSSSTSIASDFASFLAKRTVDYPMLGVMGVRPLYDVSDRSKISQHFTALTSVTAGTRGAVTDYWSNAGYFLANGFPYNDGSLDQSIDGGAYLQIVAGDVMINDGDLGTYTENAFGIYAGTVSALKPQQAATYKPVPGIQGLPWEFNRTQLDQLVGGIGADRLTETPGGGAYVCVRRIEGRGNLFVKDVTASMRVSDFKNLQPLRIANACHKGIRDICFPFLGQSNDIPHRQALTTQLKSFLDAMADAGALLGKDGIGYQLQVRGGDTPLSQLLGELAIDVVLRPALQIQAIKVRVRLSL